MIKKFITLLTSLFFSAIIFCIFPKNSLAQVIIQPRSYGGDFSISSSLDNDMVIDIPKMVNYSNLVIRRSHLGDNQSWMFIYDPVRRAHRIVSNKNKNLVLNLYKNTLNLDMPANIDSQFWILEPTYDDYTIFRNYQNTDMVLEISEISKDSIIKIGTYDYSYPDNQKWSINNINYQVIPDGTYTIATAMNLNRVLQFHSKSESNVRITNNGYRNTKWRVQYDYSKKAYRINGIDTQGVSLLWDSNNSRKIIAGKTQDYRDQFWRLEKNKDFSEEYMLRNLLNTEQVLHVPKQSAGEYNQVAVAQYNISDQLNKAHQSWRFIR